MKILVVDESKALDLALKLQKSGHDIRYISNDQAGENLVVKYQTWKDRIGWSDMVIFTGHSHASYVEVLKRKEKPVIGVTKFLSQLKDDVVFRNQLLTGLKLSVAEHEYFNSYEDAKVYLKNGKHTLKPTTNDLFQYSAESVDDMIAMLDYMKLFFKTPEFVLEKTPEGILLEVGAWHNGFKFIRPIVNKLGNAIRFTKTNRLFGETLVYLDPYLKNSRYTGYIGLRCYIREGEKPIIDDIVFGMETPIFQLQDQVIKEDWGSFLFNLSQGSLSTIKVMPRWCYAIKVFSKSVPIFLNDTEKFSHFVEIIRVGNHIHAIGPNPLICCGHAMTMKEAYRRAKETVESVGANGKSYNTEAPELDDYKVLKKLGYLDVSG